MGCSICKNLELVYLAALSEYVEACTSACYRVSNKPAAQKYVDMERALSELEEHRMLCASTAGVSARLPEQDQPKSLQQMAA
jgi:hypothetical protein